MLNHYVFIRYASGTADAHVQEFCRRMEALRTVVPGIEHLEIGRDILRDARSWDVVLIMRFASVEALRRYQRHPAHLEVMAFNDPAVDQVGSVDFFATGANA
ncbi:MAG TPA: Dabb family protein [Gammaproteobacteria bacterium]|nr:Dabb family protein [Gammaproteobacteria bacterium]